MVPIKICFSLTKCFKFLKIQNYKYYACQGNKLNKLFKSLCCFPSLRGYVICKKTAGSPNLRP